MYCACLRNAVRKQEELSHNVRVCCSMKGMEGSYAWKIDLF